MELKLTIEDILETEKGQEIAYNAMKAAFENAAKTWLTQENGAINFCHFYVKNVIGLAAEEFNEKIKERVLEKLIDDSFMDGLEYSETCSQLIKVSLIEHKPIIDEKVKAKLSDEKTYDKLEWSIGSHVVDLIKNGLEK